jgi:hypothetical protein
MPASRYAILFRPITLKDIFDDMASIALDGDCLIASTGFFHDFGDTLKSATMYRIVIQRSPLPQLQAIASFRLMTT